MSTVPQQVERLRDEYRARQQDLPAPAAVAEVDDFRAWVRDLHGAEVPAAVLEFWAQTQDCGGNGVLLYGPAEARATTENFECEQDCLLFAQRDDYWFGWVPHKDLWGGMDVGNFDDDPFRTYARFEAVLAELVDAIVR